MNMKERIGQRIQALRVAAGLTLGQLAEQTGSLKKSRIGNWEQGTRMPGPEEAKILANTLNVSPAYLLGLTDEKTEYTSEHYLPRLVPLVSLAKLASPGFLKSLLTPNSKDKDPVKLPLDETLTQRLSMTTFAITLTDNSMAPDFRLNDQVIVDPSITPQPGQIVVAVIEKTKQVVLRKYRAHSTHSTETGSIDLIPLNEDWPILTLDSQLKGKIIGTACELRRAI
jgi:SOS-response transcriptional repressor LexA